MIPYLLPGLGIGLLLAGVVLVLAWRRKRTRPRESELVVWGEGFLILVGFLLILIVDFCH